MKLFSKKSNSDGNSTKTSKKSNNRRWSGIRGTLSVAGLSTELAGIDEDYAGDDSKFDILAQRESIEMTIDSTIPDADNEDSALSAEAKLWKSAIDPKSGKTYWYHVQTKETQWRKPVCLSTPEERKEVVEKERTQRDFFAAMEANILNSMLEFPLQSSNKKDEQRFDDEISDDGTDHDDNNHIEASPDRLRSALTKTVSKSKVQFKTKMEGSESSNNSVMSPTPNRRLVRTISDMEDSVLKSLVRSVPSHGSILKKSSMAQGKKAAKVSNSNQRVRFGGIHFEPLRTTATTDDFIDNPQALFKRQSGSLRLSANNLSDDDDNTERSRARDAPVLSREESLNIFNLEPSTSSRGFNNSISISALGQQPTLSIGNFGSNSPSTLKGTGMDFDNASGSISGMEDMGNVEGFDGFQGFGESQADFDLSSEELAAFGKLSEITDQMVSVDEDDVEFYEKYAQALDEADKSLDDDEDDDGDDNDSDNDGNSDSDGDGDGGIDGIVRGLHKNTNEAYRNDSFESDSAGSEIRKNTQLASKNDHEIVLVDKNNKGSDTPVSDRVQRELEKRSSITQESGPESFKHRSRSLRTFKSDKNLITPSRNLTRQSTWGALNFEYAGSTLSAPDKDATIRCVCGVYRAHLIQSERIEYELTTQQDEGSAEWNYDDQYQSMYAIFNDHVSDRKMEGESSMKEYLTKSSKSASNLHTIAPLPTLDEITTFYRDVFQRAKMQTDCIIISLIYVERLIKTTEGILRPRVENWRSILFSCMVLSSKVWDDLSVWNDDFSQTCPAGVRFPLQRVNELEVAVLLALDFSVKVLSSEYAKYYFLLRSMLIKSGLGSDDLTAMNKLDVEGARRLQLLSSQYELQTTSSRSPTKVDKQMGFRLNLGNKI